MSARVESPARRPSWRASWIFVVSLLTAFTCFESVGFGHFAAFIPLYLPQLGVAPEEVPRWAAVFPGAAFLLGLPLSPFWGVWAEQYGRRLIILRAAYIETFVFILAAVAGNVWMLFGARMLVGLALGYGGIVFAVLSQIVPRRHVGLAIATVTMGTTLGLAAGPAFGGALAERIGFRWLFALDAGLLLLGTLLLTFFLEVPPAPKRAPAGVWRALAALGRELRAHPFALTLFAVYFLASAGLGIGRAFVPLLVRALYVGENLPSVVGLIVFGAYLANGLATPVWGKLGDRFGYARMLALAVGGAALAVLAQALAPDLAALAAALVAQGLTQSAVGPLLIAAIATHTPEESRTAILNLVYMPTYFAILLGAALGAPIVGFGLRAPFLTGAALTLAALALLGYAAARARQ